MFVGFHTQRAQVKILDGSRLLGELAAELETSSKAARNRRDLKPLATHSHSAEGFALDWSRVVAGRLATGDCRKAVHVWEPQVRVRVRSACIGA